MEGGCWQEHDSPPYLTLGGAADPLTFDWEEVKAAAAMAAMTKGRGGVRCLKTEAMLSCWAQDGFPSAQMQRGPRLVSAACFHTFSVPVGAV